MSSLLPRLGALARWQEELQAGKRGRPSQPFTWVLDDLWRAACKEAVAIELESAGDLQGARHYQDWALLVLHGHQEDPKTPAGRALLARVRRAGSPPAGTRPPFSDLVPHRGAVWGS